MKDLIARNLEYLTTLTKEEADIMEYVAKWDNDQKVAFVLAKRIFDEGQDVDKSKTK